MLKNYLKIAFRSLLKQKIYTFINVLGLSIGIACCIFIFLFVQEEWSHDAFHANADNLYRLVIAQKDDSGEIYRNTLFPHTFPQTIHESVPGVVAASGFVKSRTWISYGADLSFQQHFGQVEKDFLNMFSFPLIAGDPATALSQPDAVVISKEVADKFFPEINGDYPGLLGHVLRFHGSEAKDYTVTGVMENVTSLSSLQFDMLTLLDNVKLYGKNNNDMGETTIYLQLKPGTNLENMETSLSALIDANLGARIAETNDELEPARYREFFSLHLQPLTDVYLDQSVNSNYTEFSKPIYSYILSAIAFLVLFIACINFTTLSIGRSTTRAMEVGVRKALGAYRQQLMLQFWGEALLLTALALVLGIGVAELLLPVFNAMSQKSLSLFNLENLNSIGILFGILIVTGLMAGSYPAIILSRFSPVAVFKGDLSVGGRNRFTRGMVLVQYVLSVSLIIITLVIVQQLDFMRHKDTGFATDAVVVVDMPHENTDNVYELYKQQILKNDNIVTATGSDRAFTSGKSMRGTKNDKGEWVVVRLIRVDEDYLKTLDIDLLAGRNISSEMATDATLAVLVNEAYVKKLNWTNEQALGQQLLDLDDNQEPPVIVGVVRDFHIDSMHREIEPLVLHNNPDYHRMYRVLVRIRPSEMPQTVDFLKDTWETLVPDQPFKYAFLDEELDKQYKSEEQWSQIIGYASFFAILISCLGLLGLAALAVTRRTKEIGIRKVLGASAPNIISLIAREFLILVAIANLIAWPLSYGIASQWLQNFAYRIDLSVWVFVAAGVLVVLVALFTVSSQAIRAAFTNPVKSLRYE